MKDEEHDAFVERIKATNKATMKQHTLTCHHCNTKSEAFEKAPMVKNTEDGFKTYDKPDGWYVIFAQRGDFSGTKYFCSDGCKDKFNGHGHDG